MLFRPGGTLDISRRLHHRNQFQHSYKPWKGGRSSSVCRPSGAGRDIGHCSGGSTTG